MNLAATSFETLVRPRLLVVAARHGLESFDRDTHLPRLLDLPFGHALPSHSEALVSLMALERRFEAARRHHDASWRAADHVGVMTALLNEARASLQSGHDETAQP